MRYLNWMPSQISTGNCGTDVFTEVCQNSRRPFYYSFVARRLLHNFWYTKRGQCYRTLLCSYGFGTTESNSQPSGVATIKNTNKHEYSIPKCWLDEKRSVAESHRLCNLFPLYSALWDSSSQGVFYVLPYNIQQIYAMASGKNALLVGFTYVEAHKKLLELVLSLRAR